MIALYLSPVYLLVNGYIIWRLIKWLGGCHKKLGHPIVRFVVIVLYAIFALSVPIGFLLSDQGIGRYVKQVGNYWIGVLLFEVMVLVILEGLALIINVFRHKQNKRVYPKWVIVFVGSLCVILILGLSVYSLWHARDIKRKEYDITVFKKAGDVKDLKIVLVSDLHLGVSVSEGQMQRMKEKINAENADLVIVAGDIFDNSFSSIQNPDKISEILSQINSRFGTYACYGNHDIEEKILAGFTFRSDQKMQSSLDMDKFLKDSDITLLRDSQVLVENLFYIYGRADCEKPGRGIDERKSPFQITQGMDQAKPIIVMDHEPRQLAELAKAGVDIDLSGHTHNGQIFPGNILTALMWENSYGCIKKGEMYSIVTSGIGAFGPFMRLGTDAEICVVNVHFGPRDQEVFE